MLLTPLAFLLAALMPEPAAVQADPAIAARCEVARSVIAERLKGRQKPVVIISDSGFGDRQVSANAFLHNWTQDAMPSRALAAAFLAKPSVDLLEACPDLPQALAGDGVAFGETEMTAMMERSRMTSDGHLSTFYTSDILGFSLPVLSADRRSALMHSSATCGALCGSGAVVYLKRDRQGVWKGESSRFSWIS
jgi:hypothetical protein